MHDHKSPGAVPKLTAVERVAVAETVEAGPDPDSDGVVRRRRLDLNHIAWRRSLKLAAAVLQKDSSIADPTGGALWYHAAFVHPLWSGRLEVSGIVGGHIFYRDTEKVRLARGQQWRDPMVPALHRFAEWIDSRAPRPTAVASR